MKKYISSYLNLEFYIHISFLIHFYPFSKFFILKIKKYFNLALILIILNNISL